MVIARDHDVPAAIRDAIARTGCACTAWRDDASSRSAIGDSCIAAGVYASADSRDVNDVRRAWHARWGAAPLLVLTGRLTYGEHIALGGSEGDDFLVLPVHAEQIAAPFGCAARARKRAFRSARTF
jgi:hypothetical protein